MTTAQPASEQDRENQERENQEREKKRRRRVRLPRTRGHRILRGIVSTTAMTVGAAAIAVLAFNRNAMRKIGGHTGDTIGATQQLAEMSVLFALALAL